MDKDTILRNQPPYITIYTYHKYAYIEVDFLDCKNQPTYRNKLEIWRILSQVIAESKAWRHLLTHGEPKHIGHTIKQYINEFESGLIDTIPHIYVHHPHLSIGIGDRLIQITAEKELVHKHAAKLKEVVERLSREVCSDTRFPDLGSGGGVC